MIGRMDSYLALDFCELLNNKQKKKLKIIFRFVDRIIAYVVGRDEEIITIYLFVLV
jgi:hypothetical protein